jgi:hypothetical protein
MDVPPGRSALSRFGGRARAELENFAREVQGSVLQGIKFAVYVLIAFLIDWLLRILGFHPPVGFGLLEQLIHVLPWVGLVFLVLTPLISIAIHAFFDLRDTVRERK